MNLSNKEIQLAQNRLAEAQAFYKSTIEAEQALCKHERVGECEWKDETWFSYAKPPLRVCLDCGISDEGWGSGYKVLTNGLVYKIDRDTLFKIRVGKRYEQKRSED
jgi:hypothetical protein